ncbi:MAG TPA: GNAT family protein [Candidatus Nanoarchaeia archaeon]|nr:GNAT family protein [Candidatus Nanoarchaeia archaeon]
MAINTNIIIKAKGILLRPIKLSDAQGYLECHQDKAAKRNFMFCPRSLKASREDIKEGLTGHNIFLAIEVNKDFAGFIHLELNNNPKYKHSAIIGYGTHPKFRNMGIATKAVKALTAYAFKTLGLIRISARCRTFNKASIKVLEKCSFQLEGVLRKNSFKDGKYLDDMLWAKVRQQDKTPE